MNNTIKSKPTIYKGIEFRSKLEARVALFLDKGKIPYEYEPERLGNESGEEYNPDFYLPETDDWIEVKGKRPGYEQEILKASRFVSPDGPIKRLIIISEIPDPAQMGMPHFPCYYAQSGVPRQYCVRAGWYFFQDTTENTVSGHISRANYLPPCISECHLKCGSFDISPVSDRFLREKAVERDFEIISVAPSTKRSWSVSSIRRMKSPPSCFAIKYSYNAVLKLPTCIRPVGLGAYLVLIFAIV